MKKMTNRRTLLLKYHAEPQIEKDVALGSKENLIPCT